MEDRNTLRLKSIIKIDFDLIESDKLGDMKLDKTEWICYSEQFCKI